MLPITAIQPWMIKGGAIVLLLSAVFYGGCRTGRSMSYNKIQRMKADYTRAVEIIETFQDNVDTLDRAIKEQNESVERLGKDHDKRVKDLQEAYQKSITKLNKRNTAALREAEREAAELRKRMVGLSVGEACHEAMKEIVK